MDTTDKTLAQAYTELRKRTRAELRGQHHDVTTNKGVVAFLARALNAFCMNNADDPEGDIIERNELNTLGYVCGIQLRAIAAVQDEEKPSDSLSDLLGNGVNVEIRMTKEERKMFLTAGSVDKMASVLQEVKKDGRVMDMEEQADGSYVVKRLEQPPRTDAPMPLTEIGGALRAEGIDISRQELKTVLGPSLGGSTDDDEIEMFGFDEVFDVGPRTEPALAHEWTQVTMDNPSLPGVVIRLSKCTKCGITTRNTQTMVDSTCGQHQ